MQDLASNVSSTGQWAGAVGSGLQIASTLVQAVYELVRDAISQVVGTAISAAITTAATVGFGAPLAIGQVVTKVSSLAGRIGSFVTKLLRSLRELLPLFNRLCDVIEKVLAFFRGRLRGGSATPAATSVVEADARPYLTPGSRPSFRQGVVEDTWENAKGPDGLGRDPNTFEVIDWTPGEPRAGVWDMGHVPDQKYHQRWQEYVNGELTPAEFRDWYNDPDNYRPEFPSNNRSHRYE